MHRYSILLGFAVLVLLKGLSFPAFEIGLASFPVLMLAALRYDVAVVVLFGYVLATDTDLRPTTRGDVVAILAGGVVSFTVATALWSVGQEMTSATLSGLMASLVPIMTAAFSWILLPEDRLTGVGIAGLGVGFLGALIIMLPSGGLQFGPGVTGKVLMFVGVAATALAGVLIRWARPTLPAASQTAWAMLVGAVLLHLGSFTMGRPLRT
ncbi:DMT family transporter [Haloarculaceae archaeon H-GB2-1]|nr:DMT family transporter [Haloarculaceae archaeon H-GB11]MEA5409449.1 DMT family transporter [Haloarculaceae archaeon H-GB2-1]